MTIKYGFGKHCRYRYTPHIAHLSVRSAQNTMGTREDPKVKPGTCGTVGERAQVILV